jgi:hypothetical protein
MVSYGLTEEDESFDSLSQIPQSRKRTYPNAFPVEEPAEFYAYNAVPVAIEEAHEWNLPFGLTPSVLMTCFATALAWIQHATVEYGGRFFKAGLTSVELLI